MTNTTFYKKNENELYLQMITVEDDACYLNEPIGESLYSRKLIMTKEVFVECFHRWIKPELNNEERNGVK